MSGETPKKVNLSEDCCYLCKVKISSLKEKIKIFGKSELDISALILRSVGIDLSVYVGSKNLAICRLCYNTLNGYKKALKKVDEIVDGIQTKFKTDGPVRIKRLAKGSEPPEAKKSLSFGSSVRCENSRESMSPATFTQRSGVSVAAFTKLSPVFGFSALSPIAPLSIFPALFSACEAGAEKGVCHAGYSAPCATPKWPVASGMDFFVQSITCSYSRNPGWTNTN